MRALMTSRTVISALGLVLVGAQFIRPARTNPVVDPKVELGSEPVPQPVLATLKRACFDCHSSETRWPWYANVAPASWLLASDVRNAREQLNFSRWGKYNAFDRADLLDKVCDQVSKRKMPLWQYRIAHTAARLSQADTDAVCAWTEDEAARLTEEGK
jgi:Haem-binding domain